MATVYPLLDMAEFNYLIGLIKKEDERKSDAIILFIKLVFLWGVRAGDLLKIRWCWVEKGIKYGKFKIIESKEGKEKVLHVDDVCRELLLEYRNKYPNRIYLFQSWRYGHEHKHLTVRTVQRWLKDFEPFLNKRRRNLGVFIESSVGTHSFRKFAANERYKATRDIVSVRDFLNHSSVDTTVIYLGLRDDDLSKMFSLGSDLLNY